MWIRLLKAARNLAIYLIPLAALTIIGAGTHNDVVRTIVYIAWLPIVFVATPIGWITILVVYFWRRGHRKPAPETS